MTARRTLPDKFPTIRESDYYTRRVARGDLLRRIAQAQNYLWANARRIHSMSSYEGNGCRVPADQNNMPVASVPPPGFTQSGTQSGTPKKFLPVCSFMVPPNFGPSGDVFVKLEGFASSGVLGSNGFTVELVCTNHEVDGKFIGVGSAILLPTGVGATSINVPKDRATQVFVWVRAISNVSTDVYIVDTVSAYFNSPTSDDIFGNTLQSDWQYMNLPSALLGAWYGTSYDGYPFSTAFLRQLVRNTITLWSRPWNLCSAYIGDNLNPGATKHRFMVGPKVTKATLTVYGYAPSSPAKFTISTGNLAAIQRSVTFTAPGYYTYTEDLMMTPNAENYFTIRPDAPAQNVLDWGNQILGVTIVEQGADPGVNPPASYVPIDEELFTADDLISYDLLEQLMLNDRWLLANRPQVLVSSWRHRALKRLAYDDSLTPPPDYDWTRGASGQPASSATGGTTEFGTDGVLKNITVRGDDTTADYLGVSAHDNRDGYGKYGDGVANSYDTSSDDRLWPSTSTYYMHGRRLAKVLLTSPVSCRAGAANPSVINNVNGASILTYIRGRRCTTALVCGYGYQYTGKTAHYRAAVGPGPEEIFYLGQGYYVINDDGHSGDVARVDLRPDLQHHWISALGGKDARGRTYYQGGLDSIGQWIGPGVVAIGASPPSALNVNGRLVAESDVKMFDGTARLEGLNFEMELMSILVIDAPLTQDILNAL